ncbi:MAG: hypothetical protein ACQGVK_11555 [Myxococcota bacterium]
MAESEECRHEIIELLGEIWALESELSFGRLLIDVLQSPESMNPLRGLDDELFLWALDSYLSAARMRASPTRRPPGPARRPAMLPRQGERDGED